MQTHYDHQVGRFEAPRRLDDRDVLIARARQARAEATAEMLGALFSGVVSMARRAIGLVRGAGRGDFHPHTPARLTGGCD